MSDKKRNKISIKDKFEIIMKLSGVKREQILSEYKLKHYSNLTEIMKNESKIVEKYNSLNGKTSANVFNTRGPTHVEVEKALLL